MFEFELGAEHKRATTGASRATVRRAVQQAKAAGTRTTCCGVGYRQWCRLGCINFAVNGAAPELVWS